MTGGTARAVDLDPAMEIKTHSFATVNPVEVLVKSTDTVEPILSDYDCAVTAPPVQATMPRWSPDGTRIAYFDAAPGKPWKIHLISAEGGKPEPLLI